MKYTLAEYPNSAAAEADLPGIFPNDSLSMEVQMILSWEPYVTMDGFWVLYADEENGVETITLPVGAIAISSVFAGMPDPIIQPVDP